MLFPEKSFHLFKSLPHRTGKAQIMSAVACCPVLITSYSVLSAIVLTISRSTTNYETTPKTLAHK